MPPPIQDLVVKQLSGESNPCPAVGYELPNILMIVAIGVCFNIAEMLGEAL